MAMLNALLARLRLPASCELQGVLIAAERPANLPATIQYYCGGHPLQTRRRLPERRRACNAARAGDASPEDTLCIFLLSGGASAMMELPLDDAISLDDTIAFHRALVHSGASIVEMNCVRKHFSAVKGGGSLWPRAARRRSRCWSPTCLPRIWTRLAPGRRLAIRARLLNAARFLRGMD